MRGIFVMQGQRRAVSSFTISINDEGELTSTGPALSAGVEMAPYWLGLAINHAIRADELSWKTNDAWRSSNPETQTAALDAEFTACLQAMTPAAFMVDALYAPAQEAARAPEATRKGLEEKRH